MSGSGDHTPMAPIVEHPRFAIIRLAGQGGMGAVFQARDRELDETVALKVLSFPDPTTIDRFRREVRIARNLQHPHICQVFDIYDLPNGNRALSMAWIDGESLSKRLRRQPLPELDQILEWGSHLADALDYAHAQGVVHRDIKPGNIIIDRDERPVLVDFGIARELDRSSQLTQAGDLVGTPAYMAPEQLVPTRTDARTDLFALGVILAEMLLGEIPNGVRDLPSAILARVINPTVVDLEPSRPDLPPDLIALIRELTAPEADQRPSDGEIVAARLRALRAAATEPDRRASQPRVWPPQRTGARRLSVGVAAVGLLLVAGLAASTMVGWWSPLSSETLEAPGPPSSPEEAGDPLHDPAAKTSPTSVVPGPEASKDAGVARPRRPRELSPAEEM